MAEVDAPEAGQPYGRRAKEHLSALCFEAQATIRQTASDRYGRMVTRVECKGKDANMEMVKAGLAIKHRVKVTRSPQESESIATTSSRCD